MPSENTVTVAPDGPLYVRGDVVLKNSAGETLLRDTRVALVSLRRVGRTNPSATAAIPRAEFRDPGSLAQNKLKEDDTGTATSVTFTAAARRPLAPQRAANAALGRRRDGLRGLRRRALSLRCVHAQTLL